MVKAARPDNSLLASLPDALAAGLFAAARPVKLSADQTLFLAGDPGDGCYRVEEGLLKISVVSPTGIERILAIMGPNSVVGELSMIDTQPRSATVTALRDSQLSFISRATFDAYAADHAEVYRHIITLLARRLRETNSVVAAATFLTLKGRVARAMLTLAEAFGHDVGQGRILIRQKVNQGDLAAMVGIARENVSRILNEWKREAVVSRLAGYYCLEKKTTLEREAEL
jgi:CRP/FNR family transcriptional regulator, cyclic AMP receptor protein